MKAQGGLWAVLLLACGTSNTSSDAGSDGGGGDGGAGWKLSGLDGNVISVLAVDPRTPSTIFAGADAASATPGLFRSKDSGQTWTAVAGGLPAQSVQSVAVSPTQNAVIAAVGIATFVSTNGGDTWTESTNDPGGVSTIVFHPNGSMAFTVSSQQGMYTSSDNGASWNKITSTGLPPLNTVGLGPLAHDGAKLYLGTGGQGVYVSSDGGATFTGPSTGIPQAFADTINALATSPARPGVVFALTNADGLYRSNDSGATFTKVTAATPTRYSAALVDRLTPTIAYTSLDETQGGPGGIARTTDDGVTWPTFGPATIPVVALDESPTDGALYAGTIGRGVWRYGP